MKDKQFAPKKKRIIWIRKFVGDKKPEIEPQQFMYLWQKRLEEPKRIFIAKTTKEQSPSFPLI